MFAQKSDHPQPAAQPQLPGSGGDSSLASYSGRRSHAFELAEDAFWTGTICADAYMLFRLLTRLCKERTFCWPGLDYLAERMHSSVGTIKRRLDVLERAGLIERRQRSGGLTSYTYVRALQAFDAAPPVTKHPATEAPSLFFVPEQQISHAPDAGSALIPHTIKSQKKNPGGGRDTTTTEPTSNSVTTLLTQSGVSSPTVLDELKMAPLDEVQACVAFARKQRNIVDPAAFAVALIRLGQGAKLVQRAAQRAPGQRRLPHAPPTIARPGDPAGYDHFHCAHGRVRGSGCPECLQLDPPSVGPPCVSAVPLEGGQPTGDPQVWAAAMALLAQRLGTGVLDTWFGEARLLRVDADRAFVGAPNVFVREQLSGAFAEPLEQALARVAGRPLRIEVVVDR